MSDHGASASAHAESYLVELLCRYSADARHAPTTRLLSRIEDLSLVLDHRWRKP